MMPWTIVSLKHTKLCKRKRERQTWGVLGNLNNLESASRKVPPALESIERVALLDEESLFIAKASQVCSASKIDECWSLRGCFETSENLICAAAMHASRESVITSAGCTPVLPPVIFESQKLHFPNKEASERRPPMLMFEILSNCNIPHFADSW